MKKILIIGPAYPLRGGGITTFNHRLAKEFTQQNALTFIPPFDDLRVIEGQSTVGVEILEEQSDIDYLFFADWWRWTLFGCGFLFQNLFAQNKNHWT